MDFSASVAKIDAKKTEYIGVFSEPEDYLSN
jgi:hypothetical protein